MTTEALESRQSPAVPPRSHLGARVALVAQVLLNTAIGILGYPLATGFAVMVGYTTAQYHGLAQGFIFFTVLPSALHLLAACNIGSTRRGSIYLALSIAASAVQVLILVFWGPYGWCVAPVIAGLAVYAVVDGGPGDNAARIAALPPSRGRAFADAAIVVLSVLLLIVLVRVNNEVNDVENRNPSREFDSSESDERLASAIDPLLSVLAEVEGMPDPVRHSSDESSCMDGGHSDPAWAEFEDTYLFEEREAVVHISPNAGAGERAIEAGHAPVVRLPV